MQNQHARISISMDDGSVALMSFLTVGRGSVLPKGAEWSEAPGWWRRDPTDENVFHEISRTFARPGPQPVSYRVVSDDEVPADRTYRNALVDDGVKLTHDMGKARDIHLERLKRQRVVALEQLDKDWMFAMGRKDKQAEDAAEAKRQRWRDMPELIAPQLEAAQTTDELKAVTFAV